jgi:ketosteroid isomerase-like protein
LKVNSTVPQIIFVALHEPMHNDVSGDSAYVVVPAAMTFKVGGKQVTQTGAVFTVALRKQAESWRIAAWAWGQLCISTNPRC